MARRSWLRQALRRSSDGPSRPGEDQAAPRRGTAVRQARQRRRGEGPHQGQCSLLRERAGPAQADEAKSKAEGKASCQEEDRRRGVSSRVNAKLVRGRAGRKLPALFAQAGIGGICGLALKRSASSEPSVVSPSL